MARRFPRNLFPGAPTAAVRHSPGCEDMGIFCKGNATYVTINLGEIYIADNIKEKSFGLDGRLDELLPALREACEA